MAKVISKFNKKRCMSCVYKCTISGGAGVKASPKNIACYYSALSGKGACLTSVHGKVIDRRGEDYNNCQLFERGDYKPRSWG